MKKMILTVLMPLLGGCAGTAELAGSGAGTETLRLNWAAPGVMEVSLDGKRYAGAWDAAKCFTDACRGVFRNVPRIDRRHVRHGQAVLLAKDGSRLVCAGVGYRERFEGTCAAADGRSFRLLST
ncbi:MAG TPA: hypothetical protein PLW81_08725 [Thiobacillaceae bacterium]|nr:hypothetical protein [Thiobacillaceae bacterium]